MAVLCMLGLLSRRQLGLEGGEAVRATQQQNRPGVPSCGESRHACVVLRLLGLLRRRQ